MLIAHGTDTEQLAGGSFTITLDEPAGLTAGETLLGHLLNVDTTGTPDIPPPPTGFTSVQSDIFAPGAFNTVFRVADGTESGPYASAIGGNGEYRSGKMTRILGAHPTSPIDGGDTASGTSNTVAFPTVTATNGPGVALTWVTSSGQAITSVPTGAQYELFDSNTQGVFMEWVPEGATSTALTCGLAASTGWYASTVMLRADPARPAIVGRVQEVGTSLGSNNAQSLPANAAAGQLVVYCAINDTPSTTNLTGSTGWATAAQQTQGSNVIKAQLFARLLDGTAGSNILSITGASQDYAVIGVAIANHGLADQAEVAAWLASAAVAGTTGSSATADPPNANPAVSDDYLALAFAGIDATSTGPANSISAPPSQWGDLGPIALSASSTSSVALRAAALPVTASSLNPAAFANSNRGWIAYTLLIPPASSVPATPAAPTLTAGVGELVVDLPTLPDADSVDLEWVRTVDTRPSVTTQSSAPWHLARIDGEGDSDYAQRWTGDEVYIYVIDSGVNADHDEFEDRAEPGASASGQNGVPTWAGDGPNPWVDQTPHGTGCASAAAGLMNGVAKKAIIVPVKIGGAWTGPSSGLTEDIYNIPPATGTAHAGTEGLTIEAYEWAYEWILAHFQSLPAGTRALITDSVTSRITGTTTPSTTGEAATLATAVQACLDAGIPVFCLAQNFDQVTAHVPATMADTICMGGIDETDARFVTEEGVSGSNFGAPVDLFAPARLDPTIGAPSHTSDTTYDTSVVGYGTSTATPIGGGCGALLLQENPHITPARLKNVMQSQAFAGEIDLQSATDTVNLIVNSLSSTALPTITPGITDGYTLDGVEPGVEYRLRIRQWVDGVPSEWSTPATETTLVDGLDVTRGPADTLDATDGVSWSMARARTVGDTSAATDTVAPTAARLRLVADTAPLSDATAARADRSRVLADIAPGADTAVRAVAAARAAADTAALADTATRAPGRARTLSDGAALADATATRADRARPLSETAALADVASPAAARARTLGDTLPAIDQATPAAARARTVDDTATGSDATTPQITTGGTSIVRTIGDTAALSDAQTPRTDRGRQIGDQSALSDHTTPARGMARTVSDTVPGTDQATRAAARARAVSDLEGAADATTPARALHRSVVDTAGLTDTVARTRGLARVLSDTVTAVSTVTRSVARTRLVAAVLGLIDQATALRVGPDNVDDVDATVGVHTTARHHAGGAHLRHRTGGARR